MRDDDHNSHLDLLPDSRPRVVKNRVQIKGTTFVPIYCANCSAPGGGVPEECMTFVFYLCTPCSEKYGAIANTYTEPDAVFFERVRLAMLEEHGRILDGTEAAIVLDDPNSKLSLLAREAPKGK